MVLSKTPENFHWLDRVIEDLDQPTSAGIPEIVPLRYASAVEVAEQLNALLAEAGAGATIRGAEEGLTKGDIGSSSIVNGNGANASGGASGAGGTSNPNGNAANNQIQFPWQQGRQGNQEKTPESSLIGRVRVVPIIRQNALSILATAQVTESIKRIITTLDQPGRQVLISAIVASIELADDFAYGLRIGNDGIVTTLSDNVLTAGITVNNTENNFIPGFDSSVLNINVTANAVLQAIDQKTNVKILQQPKLFVADNTEGVVFIGQEIPFITNSQFTDTGNQNQAFEYKPVGVTLNVRPHITSERDVALEVNLTLSEVVPGQVILGGAVLNRRTTLSEVTIRNGQTVVLSGIRVETQSDVKRKLPLLGDVPGLGDLLFTSTEKADQVRELIAFITPIIVDNPEDNDINYNAEARQRLESLRKPLKEFVAEEKSGATRPFQPTFYQGDLPATPGPLPSGPDAAPVQPGGAGNPAGAPSTPPSNFGDTSPGALSGGVGNPPSAGGAAPPPSTPARKPVPASPPPAPAPRKSLPPDEPRGGMGR
ncbi:MAG: secretin N-terminal domain-containing protein [Phycisphaerales bacterium]